MAPFALRACSRKGKPFEQQALLPIHGGTRWISESTTGMFKPSNSLTIFEINENDPHCVDGLGKEITTTMATADVKSTADSIAAEPGYWDSATLPRTWQSAPLTGARLRPTLLSSIGK